MKNSEIPKLKISLWDFSVLMAIAWTGTLSLLLFWWLAFIGGQSWNPEPWAVVIVFNRLNEQWLEGGLFHIAALALLWNFRYYFMKDV
jgi:hypothetical protein